MPNTFYLALTDGTTTLVLTDGTNFTLEDDGWYPALALDSEQRTVVDTIKINVLGATTSGGVSDPYTARKNMIALLSMLRQVQRGQEGDGGVVRLIYTSPGSSPARRMACMVTAWDASTFPVDQNAAQNLVQSEYNGIVLTLEHRVPWQWQSYLYDNAYPSSLWTVVPTPTGINAVVASPAATGEYGGAGSVTATKSTAAAAAVYLSVPHPSVTSGVPITFSFTIAYDLGLTSIRFLLIDSGAMTTRSSDVTLVVSGTALITAGTRMTATVTPTFTGNVRLYWEVTGPIGATFGVMEVTQNADETVWHRDNAIEGASTTSGAVARSVVQTSVVPTTPAPAPTRLYYATGPTTWATGVIVVAKTGNLTTYPLPPAAALSAAFTSVADAGNNAIGNILRYTPVSTATVTQNVEGPTALPGNYSLLAARVVGSASYTIALVAYNALTGTSIATRAVTLAPRTMPYYVIFPRLSYDTEEGGPAWRLSITASAFAATTLDMDWWASVVDTEDTTIITHDANAGASALNLTVNPNWTTLPLPSGLVSKDSLLIMSKAVSLDTMWAATTNTTLWRTAISPTLSISREPAFDAPL